MIQTGFESRVKVQQLVESQLPSFILDESPKTADFLKQYYISQEYQGGPIDITDNLDQYLKLDNLSPEVVVESTTLSAGITTSSSTIQVSSTRGFPNEYGLFKIGDEIITYTGITTNSFTGCIRGFSGITDYHQELNQEDIVFSTSTAASHSADASVQNLSALFLKEFYKKLKYTFVPGFENLTFVDEIDVGNFIKYAKNFYEAKGTDDSIRILFNVLFGETPRVVNLEEYLIKPSSSNYIRREIVVAEAISGDPLKLVGQTITKSTDTATNASISSVEIFTRKGRTYYQLELFVGYDTESAVQGTFKITPNTKALETVNAGASVIDVDSTISFADSGTIISGDNTISYTGKTVNQFLGCTGIDTAISPTDNVRSEDTYFSYENGDTSKKVELIFFGVARNLKQTSSSFKVDEGDIVRIKSVGDKIENNNATYKEIFANSWIYNTSSRNQISDNSSLELASPIDRSSLKVGDEVEILERGTETVVAASGVPYIESIDAAQNSVVVANLPTLDASTNYDLRRKSSKASSSSVTFEYGNGEILSDVLNLYTENDEYAYVASNSLPAESKTGINTTEYRYSTGSSLKSVSVSSADNFEDLFQGEYSTIALSEAAPFINGDKVYYKPTGENLVGIDTGYYFVGIQTNIQKFKLYASPAFVGGANYLSFDTPTGVGTHNFILASQQDEEVGAQKLLRKFPLQKNIERGTGEKTIPGSTGMLINGVEINNYKSTDKIYYGPLSAVNVLNGGVGFDVINPPVISVDSGSAKIQPVVSGELTNVYVDSQDYDIDRVVSTNITGGNGSGAVIEPVLAKRVRDVQFDSRSLTDGGGVSIATNQITFLTNHNFVNGEEIVYNSLGNNVVGVATTTQLVNNATYFVQVDNNTTVTLYNTLSDQIAKTNVVGLFTGSQGTHKFSTAKSKNVVSYVRVIEGGSGYTNRKLIVKPTGISSARDTINFDNHGFNSGELITYNFETTAITGVSTSNQYYVLKVDDNSFRICDAGVGGTTTTNFDRQNYLKFTDTGVGNQFFAYPDISVSITYVSTGIGSTTQERQNLVTTPVVRGSLIDAYLYEAGTGYGSTVINFEKKPTFTIKNGKQAEVTPVVLNGSINSVNVTYGGLEYNSVPDLVVEDSSGSGGGAELRAIISGGKISSVKVINAGIGYSATSTKVKIISAGKNSVLELNVRDLTVNDNADRFSDGEVYLNSNDNLRYSVSQYFDTLKTSFKEAVGNVSGIIGWAYDGNPIYGPFGHSDAEDTTSTTKTLQSGYELLTANVVDRPSGFTAGYFIEDYTFNDSGDLDEYNGRFEKTVEFPNGVYAYHATLDDADNTTPTFPYFIGNEYYSKTVKDVNLNQGFDFNSSILHRNTFPYNVAMGDADYDFINEIDDVTKQQFVIESVTGGFVKSINIESAGDGFKVGDKLSFNEDGTDGSGLDVDISSIKGKEIVELQTTFTNHTDAIFTWQKDNRIKATILPKHDFTSLDFVALSGFTTTLSKFNKDYQITVPSYSNGATLSTITAAASIGFTTEIYVSPVPNGISIGSSIGIGTETMSILGISRNQDILRVERGLSGVSHTVGVAVTFFPDSFTFEQSSDYFESKVNDKVYFNPRESLGVGTVTGVSTSVTFAFGDVLTTRDIPSKSIFLEEHPFSTNQQISYTSGGTNFNISSDGSTTFAMPSTVFVVKKNKNLIGIKTTIDTSEVFFHTNGADNDKYLFESTFVQVLGDIEQSKATVSVSTSHGLSNGDIVKLDVNPSLSVGVGTSTGVRVLYKPDINSVVINPIGFNSTGINTTTNVLTLTDHGLETGDKIYFEDSTHAALDKNYFYVYRINSNKISLCNTKSDTLVSPPTVVSIASTGGSSQLISLINPQIDVVKNNDLVFDLTDSSLEGYELKLFYDIDFHNEFVSIGDTTSFAVTGVGTVGVSTNASLTLKYNTSFPEVLYYTIQNAGIVTTSDTSVTNYSKIKFINSSYENSYKISGTGTTTFTLNLAQKPEKLSYVQSECDTLEYSTTSETATGAVKNLHILSSGSGYKKLPTLESTNSTNGKNLIVSVESDTIGNLNQTRSITDNFIYSPDLTLRPEADISPLITVSDSNTISDIDIVSFGEGYTKPPAIKIIDTETRNVLDTGSFDIKISGTSIQSIEVDSQPVGLPDSGVELFSVDNTNGISVQEVLSEANSGIFTCKITTPTRNGVTGFSSQPFNVGDKVFVEGIQKYGTDGEGFNSEDFGYKFLEVTNYVKGLTVNDQVTLSISGLGTITGIAKTAQDSSGTVINKRSYPEFSVTQSIREFLVGEKLISNDIERDLVVVESNQNLLKVNGSYKLSLNEIITGTDSGNVATITTIENNEGEFEVDYANNKDLGWEDEIGKLNEDFQVTPNNDYFQNLSYTIQSSKTWEEQESVVNNLVHVSGLKNFADVGITSVINDAGVSTVISDTNFYDIFIDEHRVDAVYNFDNVLDIDVVDGKSKFIKLENKKLTDFIDLRSNDVLKIDDVSSQFSNSEADITEFVNIFKLGEGTDPSKFENYILRVTNTNNTQIQFNDLTIFNDGTSSFIFDNEFLSNDGTDENGGAEYGTFELHTDRFDDTFLRFSPDDPNNIDYDIKLIKQTFNSITAGVGSTAIGFVDLLSSINVESTGTGISTIVSLNSGEFESLFLTAQVIDNTTNDMNFVKMLVSHNGTDSFVSEYYADSEDGTSLVGNSIGTFGADLSSGMLSITHTNDSAHEVQIKTNIVGFGTTSVGVGTFRYLTGAQTDTNERSAVYESKFYDTVSAGITTVLTLDKNLFNASKSFIEVSIGATKALHQVLAIHDNSNVYTHQMPFLSLANTEEFDTSSGVGTFGGDFNGDNLEVKFYPDSDQTGITSISVFSKSLYTALDIVNNPPSLDYGKTSESMDEVFYNSINGDRINKFDFELTSNTVPVFAKVFDPNSVALAATTGIFSIDNHFFRTGEELVYTPNSTFVGVGTSAMMTSGSAVLPTTVFAIKLTNDTFKVALTEADANAGTGVTFPSLGEGNAHRFSMAERNSKTIISIDNLVQYPIKATKIVHTLSGNGGQIGTASTIFTLSGISTISPKDILKINDEFMEVTNVGLGTTNVGPITNSGTENLVLVKRGFVGTAASAHNDTTSVRVHKGAYNITDDNKIHFTDAPKGNPQIDKTDSNLDFQTSTFGGRAFLRSDYSTNQIYDDLSDEFSGIGRTFTMKVGGANTTGIGSTGGSGIVFINNVFQTPTTDNNKNNNYSILDDGISGITTIVFSGLTKPDIDPLEFVVSDSDVNANETPRGGIIVSLGSTPGAGFAPLVGASVTAVVGAGGSIVSVGLGATDNNGSGYNGLVSIGISVFESGHSGSVASISATVGAGGTLTFNVGSGGTGYTSPEIFVTDPSYENLPVIGVSRLSIGSTTDTGTGLLLDVKVGPATAGVGSTLFEVTEFKIARNGYAFRRGDVLKPVGLVTDKALSSPLADFELTVLDTYSDNFASWEFGELDYIDSVKNYQDGVRVRFPLFYQSELLSFEPAASLAPDQPLENLLLIFVNGILQEPGVSYQFTGGTSFVFTTAPKETDDIAIFFYRGVSGTDSVLVTDVNQSLKVGDTVQVLKNDSIRGTVTQDERTIFDLSFSDKFETDSYNGVGIDETNVKPLKWIKQKVDKVINGENIYKTRDSIESLVFPTARIIGDFSTTADEIFVDDAQMFDYEDDKGASAPPSSFNGLVVSGVTTVADESVELVQNFVAVAGFSGIVTGITTTTGTGSHPLALEFEIHSSTFTGIATGYPIYIFDTRIGTGVTSVDDSNAAVVGIGTTFLDCVYKVSTWSSSGTIGIITCNVDSGSPVVGLGTTGNLTSPVGKYSWGRLSNITDGLTRSSNPVSLGVTGNIVSGLSTYPTIQRRSVGLRDTGALPKIIL